MWHDSRVREDRQAVNQNPPRVGCPPERETADCDRSSRVSGDHPTASEQCLQLTRDECAAIRLLQYPRSASRNPHTSCRAEHLCEIFRVGHLPLAGVQHADAFRTLGLESFLQFVGIKRWTGSAKPWRDRFVRGRDNDEEPIGAAREGNETLCNLIKRR